MIANRRKQLVIDYKDAANARNLFLGMGVITTVAGAYFSITNPQFTNVSRDSIIYTNATMNNRIMLSPSNRSRNFGLGLCFAGLAMVGASMKYDTYVAMDQENHLGEAANAVNSTAKKSNFLDTKKLSNFSTEQREHLFYPVIELISQHPWLVNAMNAHSTVIIGSSGSGKSRLAMSIAILKAIVNLGEIDVADLDARQNITSKCWVAGQVYGSYEQQDKDSHDTNTGKQLELIAAFNRAKDPSRDDNSKHKIFLWDEVGKTGDETAYELLADRIIGMINLGGMEARKRQISAIYCNHAMPAGMWNIPQDGEASGILNNLYKTSCVLYLASPSNDEESLAIGNFGKNCRAEILYHKKSGEELSSSSAPPDPNKPIESRGKWTKYNLPLALDPVVIKNHFQPYLSALGLDLRIPNVLNESKEAQRKAAEKIAANMGSNVKAIDDHYDEYLSERGKILYFAVRKAGYNPVNFNRLDLLEQITDMSAQEVKSIVAAEKKLELSEDKKSFRFV